MTPANDNNDPRLMPVARLVARYLAGLEAV